MNLAEFDKAKELAQKGEAEGIDYLFNLIKNPPHTSGTHEYELVAASMTALEVALERSGDYWTDDHLQRALTVNDHRFTCAGAYEGTTQSVVKEAAKLHFLAREELAKRGRIPGDDNARVFEVIRLIENGFYQIEAMHAFKEIANLGPAASPAIPAVLAYWKQHLNEFSFSKQAAMALGHIGPPALPALKEMLHFGRIHTGVGEALVAIGEESIPVLLDALVNGNDYTKADAALAFCSFGKMARSAVEPLASIACGKYESSDDTPGRTALAIGWICSKLDDGDPLKAIGVDALLKVLTRDSPNRIRKGLCALSLARIGRESVRAIPALEVQAKWASAQGWNYRELVDECNKAIRQIQAAQT